MHGRDEVGPGRCTVPSRVREPTGIQRAVDDGLVPRLQGRGGGVPLRDEGEEVELRDGGARDVQEPSQLRTRQDLVGDDPSELDGREAGEDGPSVAGDGPGLGEEPVDEAVPCRELVPDDRRPDRQGVAVDDLPEELGPAIPVDRVGDVVLRVAAAATREDAVRADVDEARTPWPR